MAVYDQANTNVHDLKEVNDTLYSISEKLRFYFKSLSIEDNFTPELYLKYQETGEKLSIVELAEDGLISTYADLSTDTNSQIAAMYGSIALRVTKGDVTNQLNLEPDALSISGNRLEITGDNITLDADNNLTIKGQITATAGSIAGWTISNNKLIGTANSKITCDKLVMTDRIGMTGIEINGDSDFSGSFGDFQRTNIETDKTTIFLNGFTAYNIDAYGDIVSGYTRSYQDINVIGQITCKKCNTKADGTSWSDIRLKSDIEDITDAEARQMLNELKPYRYRFKADGRISCGFLAQDILETENGMKDYGLVSKSRTTLSLSYVGIIPFLIKALQRQKRELDELSEQ